MNEPRQIELALLIADLAGYTALTETHGAMRVAADYSELDMLLVAQMMIGLALPFAAILYAMMAGLKSA